MRHISKTYLYLAILLFFTEVLIALFAHDRWIRPLGGDFLVVIFLYCLLKSFWNVAVWRAALSVLLFAYVIEIMQYFKLVQLLGLQHSRLARIVIGTSFEWSDLLAYTLGILLVLLIEKATESRRR
jgi:Protein of unknown function (DUF2809)